MVLKNGVVLTGGIATGKSTTGAFLSMFGFRVIDADKIGHKILDEKREVIKEFFGEKFVVDGKVDRKSLGKLIFSDEEKRNLLENILHPPIKEEILKRAEKEEKFGKPYFLEIPLFFEKKSFDISKILLVYAPKELQLKRVMKRDKISENEALLKISSQIDIEEKKALSTWIIDNSKDLNHLQSECEKMKETILKSFE